MNKKELFFENETRKHQQLVARYLTNFAMALLQRANEHDSSKFEKDEREIFIKYTPMLKKLTYGSAKYKKALKEMKPALDHHYAHNAHHPENILQNEKWKVMDDKLHYVSNIGRIKRIKYIAKRYGKTGNCTKPEIIRKFHITPKGYARLQINGKSVFVHTLVATYFIGPKPNPKAQVNHKDGNKTNNYVKNIEWVTPSKNLQHAYDTGLRQPCIKYVVHCKELDITTFGLEKMRIKLNELGYLKIFTSGILRCINSKTQARHCGLTFTSYNINEYKETHSLINSMDLVDIIEMLCDWYAATHRHDNGDIGKSIEMSEKRFGINEQLSQLFRNTIDQLSNKECPKQRKKK